MSSRSVPGQDGARRDVGRSIAFALRLDAALVEAAITAGARSWMKHTPLCLTFATERDGWFDHQGRSIEVAARVYWSPPAWGISVLRTARRQKRKFGPVRGSARVLDCERPRFLEERTIFMAVGREGYVGAVRVEDGSLNVAAAFEPVLVRHWGGPDWRPRRSSRRLVSRRSPASKTHTGRDRRTHAAGTSIGPDRLFCW